jgi:hypothetical protein
MREMVHIDGGGERWKAVNYYAAIVLRSEKSGALVTVDEATLRGLALELDGKIIKPLGPRCLRAAPRPPD